MIPKEVVEKIRPSTCAVHRLPMRHEDAGFRPGDRLNRISAVQATAFFVHETILLTNSHVVQLIAADHVQTGNHDHWYVEYTYPTQDGSWDQTFRRIDGVLALIDPTGSGYLDVGLLSIKTEAVSEFHPSPVDFGGLSLIVVGTDVGVCGFPFGDELLKGSKVWRFGPVFHHGIISGVSPFHTAEPRGITSFLTDMNTAGGMSGSPVFLAENGLVIGVHYAGVQGTLGCAVPVDQKRVTGWINHFEKALSSDEPVGSISVTGGGDIVS